MDDDGNERLLMQRSLADSLGYNPVTSYASGSDALARIPSAIPHVVLMDIRMPGMNGMQCARRLKRVLPDLVVIMISGFDHPNGLAEALEAGAEGYLTKPLCVDPFLAILNRCQECRVNETSALCTSPFPEDTLIDQPTVRAALRRMVTRMEKNFHAREDLLQEALVYFWSREQQYPRRQLNWHLLSVRNYLRDRRSSGRSLDSPKRRGAQAAFAGNREGWDEGPELLLFDEGILSSVYADDTFALLAAHLEPIDLQILKALFQGAGVCDVAKNLHVSHGFVSKHRLHIASLAMKLGLAPLPARPRY